MGEFAAGKWVFGFAIYFFVFFLVLYSIANAAETYDLEHNTQVADVGFQTEITPREAGCQGRIEWSAARSCDNIRNAEANETCNSIPGCTWRTGIFREFCDGTPNLALMNVADRDCSNANETVCAFFGRSGCDFVPASGIADTSTSLTGSYSNKGIINTINFLFGFNATLGIPAAYQFIISFLFFWLPFFAMMWAVYMSIPFLH